MLASLTRIEKNFTVFKLRGSELKETKSKVSSTQLYFLPHKVCRGTCNYPVEGGVARDGVGVVVGGGGDDDEEVEVKGVSSLAMALVTFDVTSNAEVSAAEKRSAIYNLENHAREQHWGEILDKSFSSQNLHNSSNGYCQSHTTT